MAKAKATCTCGTCGKTFVKERVCANRRDADSWEAWAVKHYDECPECWQAAEAARLADKVAARPALTGTEKQIAWANKIREEILATGRELEAEEPARYWMDWLISTKRSASWWIDHRFKDCYSLIPETAAEYLEKERATSPEEELTMKNPIEIIKDNLSDMAVEDTHDEKRDEEYVRERAEFLAAWREKLGL